MFCSNCGKSLRPDDEKCPHCGATVGESRFEGNPPYTGAQEKLRPGKAVRSYGKHYSTEFVVTREDEDEVPSDTDSIYRSAMGIDGRGDSDEENKLFNAEEEEPEYTADEEPEAEEKEEEKAPFGLKFLHKKKAVEEQEPEEPEPEEEVGEDGLTDSERSAISADDSFTPVEPKGISQDVSAYMERLRENSAKKQAKAKKRSKAREEELGEDEFADSARAEGKAAERAKAKAAKPEPEEKAEKKPSRSLFGKKDKPQKEETPKKEPKKEKPRKAEPKPVEPEEPELTDDEDDDFEDERSKKRFSLSFLKNLRKGKDKPEPDLDIDEDEEPEDDEVEEEEYSDEQYLRDESRKKRFRLIKNIAVIAVALAVIVGAIIGVSGVREKSKTAPIETVTLSLWNEGMELIQYRCSDSYRVSMLALYDKNNPASYTTMQRKFTDDLDSLDSLLPENPLGDDQRFINALKAIQESINNCLSNDALSMTDGTKTAAEKDADSALRWESVQTIVNTLSRATNIGQLDAIIKGERVELIQQATAVPEPTATPAPYTTLAKGATGLAVTNLQQRLTELGYMSSSIDGDYGNKTKTAVEKFQQKAGLEVTGIADVATQELLYSDDAPKAK